MEQTSVLICGAVGYLDLHHEVPQNIKVLKDVGPSHQPSLLWSECPPSEIFEIHALDLLGRL